MEFLGILYSALAGYQIMAILLGIFVDLGLGIAAALRTRTFDGDKVANFYQTQVLPDIVGYTVIHVAIKISIMYPGIINVFGDYAFLISEALLGVALGTIIIKLAKSALESIKKLTWNI